jgi:hypothetical protein
MICRALVRAATFGHWEPRCRNSRLLCAKTGHSYGRAVYRPIPHPAIIPKTGSAEVSCAGLGTELVWRFAGDAVERD